MRPCARSIAQLVLAGCVGGRSDDEVATPTPAVATAAVAAPVIAAERACGEAGPTPTPLPPRLARGMLPVGDGVLRAGESATVGTVKLRYDRSAWIGTMEVGHSGPALVVEIDQAEAKGGPWGAQQELHPGDAFPMHVGPYRVDVRAASSEPIESLTFSVARDDCEAAATIARSSAPVWLWLSTEAIRQHTYDLEGALLQVAIDAHGAAPRLDVKQLGYDHWFAPRPGEPRVFHVGRDVVTIEEVVPGPGTRFEQAWVADGDAHLHARVRIEPTTPAIPREAVAATTACGEPAPSRTRVPAALRARPTIAESLTLRPGERRRLGALELELETLVVPGSRFREDSSQQNLLVRGASSRSVGLGGGYRALLVRLDRELLRLDLADAGAPRVGLVKLSCPEGQVIPALTAPIHAWLSTGGHARLAIGGSSAPTLQIQLHADPDRPLLAITAEQAYLTRTITPSDIGLAFTIAGHLVEIVDVEAGDGTRPDAGRWVSDGPLPLVHLQVRVSPAASALAPAAQ